MSGIIFNLANMLRLRGGPQYMPASWLVTGLLVVLYLVQNLITGQQLEDDNAAAKSLLAIGLQFVVLAVLLNWRRHTERFAQTLSALAGVGLVFNAIIWFLLSLSDTSSSQSLLALSWFTVFIWSLFVDAHIYRQALSVPFSTGMLITVLMLAASYIAIEMLFFV